ncbi:hypothetical protein H7F51_17675 [Novosphingobium flavum]|uniref:SGNH hydrolase-type esterase domain-containing protein n=1 Tax=Novosphingobium flavum TaxID=1778672 RepID=A0A7X1FVW1_9SPHN|nr:GDSL-type esterase/lipase family protein [Novosphingobium flavum]MBC2667352.1 hypothetical protein [Novosphingobium flavum]
MKKLTIFLAAIASFELVLLSPLAKDKHLRFQYTQTLARWLAKAHHPNAVFLGDSLTAGGLNFNDWRDVNLGSNGLQTYQIAAGLKIADKFQPVRISVLAGMNDAIRGPLDEAQLHSSWRAICADPRVVVTLPPPTGVDEFNQRLDMVRDIIRAECTARPLIVIEGLADASGRLRPGISDDGVHPGEDFYSRWRDQLARAGI